MLPDNIDDIFRQKLEGHTTPPAPDLWARLALPAAATDPVDTTFREGLRGHAPPPRRALWERLEDEHLRPQPRRRRGAAWWQYSAAAVLLLALLAGAGLLWQGGYQPGAGGAVARRGRGPGRTPATRQLTKEPTQPITSQSQTVAHLQDLVAIPAPGRAANKKKPENSLTQATAPRASTSSTPVATTARPRRAATAAQAAGSHPPALRQQPDAAADALASHGGQRTPPGQSFTTQPEQPTSTVTPATHPSNSPILAATAPATTPEIIEVEVRRGPAAPTAVAVAEATPAPARRRGLRLGGLLRQADHLVHGEPVSLAEATNPAEIVTVQARLGGRLISKNIQL